MHLILSYRILSYLILSDHSQVRAKNQGLAELQPLVRALRARPDSSTIVYAPARGDTEKVAELVRTIQKTNLRKTSLSKLVIQS